MPETLDNEQVLAHRMRQFLRLGFDAERAGVLAETGVDWHQAAALIDQQCPLDIAFEILSEF